VYGCIADDNMDCYKIGCVDLRIGSDGTLQCQLFDGRWGSVCSEGFDTNAARAACAKLGYYGESRYTET